MQAGPWHSRRCCVGGVGMAAGLESCVESTTCGVFEGSWGRGGGTVSNVQGKGSFTD
jgi:hypothetical protein